MTIQVNLKIINSLLFKNTSKELTVQIQALNAKANSKLKEEDINNILSYAMANNPALTEQLIKEVIEGQTTEKVVTPESLQLQQYSVNINDEEIKDYFQDADREYVFFDRNARNYNLIVKQYKKIFTFCKFEVDHIEKSAVGAGDITAHDQAYKIMVGWSTTESFIKFLHGKSLDNVEKPVYKNLSTFILPNRGDSITLSTWQTLIRGNHGVEVMKLFSYADKIEKKKAEEWSTKTGEVVSHHIAPDSVKEAKTLYIQIKYPRYSEDPELVELFYKYALPETDFTTSLEVKKLSKTKDNLPNIVIDGNKVNYIKGKEERINTDGYIFGKLPIDDPYAPIIGAPTGCCLKIGKNGKNLVIDAITKENNGFLVLWKDINPTIQGNFINEHNKINYEKYKIIAVSYTRISTQGNLILESIEYHESHTKEPGYEDIVFAMYKEFSEKVVRDTAVARVTIGQNGRYIKEFKEAKPTYPETPLEGVNYDDNLDKQALIVQSEKLSNIIATLQEPLFGYVHQIISVKQGEKIKEILDQRVREGNPLTEQELLRSVYYLDDSKRGGDIGDDQQKKETAIITSLTPKALEFYIKGYTTFEYFADLPYYEIEDLTNCKYLLERKHITFEDLTALSLATRSQLSTNQALFLQLLDKKYATIDKIIDLLNTVDTDKLDWLSSNKKFCSKLLDAGEGITGERILKTIKQVDLEKLDWLSGDQKFFLSLVKEGHTTPDKILDIFKQESLETLYVFSNNKKLFGELLNKQYITVDGILDLVKQVDSSQIYRLSENRELFVKLVDKGYTTIDEIIWLDTDKICELFSEDAQKIYQYDLAIFQKLKQYDIQQIRVLVSEKLQVATNSLLQMEVSNTDVINDPTLLNNNAIPLEPEVIINSSLPLQANNSGETEEQTLQTRNVMPLELAAKNDSLQNEFNKKAFQINNVIPSFEELQARKNSSLQIEASNTDVVNEQTSKNTNVKYGETNEALSINDNRYVAPTKGDGNCFFHATFGEPHMGEYNKSIYYDEFSQARRDVWARGIGQFKSIGEMPANLREGMLELFETFYNDPNGFEYFFTKQQWTLLKKEIELTNQEIDKVKENVEQAVQHIAELCKTEKIPCQQLYKIFLQNPLPSDTKSGTNVTIETLKNNPTKLTEYIRENLKECTKLVFPNKNYEKNYLSERTLHSFLQKPKLFDAYKQAIKSNQYFIHAAEFPILASIFNVKVILHHEMGDSVIYEPKKEIRDIFLPILQDNRFLNTHTVHEATIKHQGMHFSAYLPLDEANRQQIKAILSPIEEEEEVAEINPALPSNEGASSVAVENVLSPIPEDYAEEDIATSDPAETIADSLLEEYAFYNSMSLWALIKDDWTPKFLKSPKDVQEKLLQDKNIRRSLLNGSITILPYDDSEEFEVSSLKNLQNMALTNPVQVIEILEEKLVNGHNLGTIIAMQRKIEANKKYMEILSSLAESEEVGPRRVFKLLSIKPQTNHFSDSDMISTKKDGPHYGLLLANIPTDRSLITKYQALLYTIGKEDIVSFKEITGLYEQKGNLECPRKIIGISTGTHYKLMNIDTRVNKNPYDKHPLFNKHNTRTKESELISKAKETLLKLNDTYKSDGYTEVEKEIKRLHKEESELVMALASKYFHTFNTTILYCNFLRQEMSSSQDPDMKLLLATKILSYHGKIDSIYYQDMQNFVNNHIDKACSGAEVSNSYCSPYMKQRQYIGDRKDAIKLVLYHDPCNDKHSPHLPQAFYDYSTEYNQKNKRAEEQDSLKDDARRGDHGLISYDSPDKDISVREPNNKLALADATLWRNKEDKKCIFNAYSDENKRGAIDSKETAKSLLPRDANDPNSSFTSDSYSSQKHNRRDYYDEQRERARDNDKKYDRTTNFYKSNSHYQDVAFREPQGKKSPASADVTFWKEEVKKNTERGFDAYSDEYKKGGIGKESSYYSTEIRGKDLSVGRHLLYSKITDFKRSDPKPERSFNWYSRDDRASDWKAPSKNDRDRDRFYTEVKVHTYEDKKKYESYNSYSTSGIEVHDYRSSHQQEENKYKMDVSLIGNYYI